MNDPGTSGKAGDGRARGTGFGRGLLEAGSALSLTVGRGAVARMVADLAELASGDTLADVGCGPGTAVREAARRGARATGIDPSRQALRIAGLLTSAALAPRVTWADGSAEALPLADGAVTVAWAISSAHHWADRAAGIAEIGRVVGADGRALIADRLITPGARGHAAHGLTHDEADSIAGLLSAAGFAGVRRDVRRAGRRTMVIIQAARAC